MGCDILIVYSKLNQNILTMLFTCSERFKQIWGSFLGQTFCTWLRKRQGAKVGDRSTIRANWLYIGCPEFVGSRKKGISKQLTFLLHKPVLQNWKNCWRLLVRGWWNSFLRLNQLLGFVLSADFTKARNSLRFSDCWTETETDNAFDTLLRGFGKLKKNIARD